MVNKNNLSNRSISTDRASPTHHQSSYTPAEKLTRADDLMSDVLDCFLWPTTHSKRTIKFTPGYRRPRALNINDFKQIIHSVQTGQLKNLTEATTLIRQLPAVILYLNNAEPPRLGKHIGLYLQLFLPKCGIRFCETDRYDQRRQAPTVEQQPPPGHQLPSTHCSSAATQSPPSSSSSSKSTRQRSKVRANELRDLITSSQLSPRVSPSTSRRSSTRLVEPYTPSNNLTHLAVFAARDYAPNDIIVGCEGSFADLTEEEDLKLRSNAHLPAQADRSTGMAPRESTDFSHIVNSRGKFQVFCGPARFVNHDCDNNAVLLREGFTIKFKVTKPIKAGQEILTSYGMNYFGEKNRECMCATCERNGRGFYSKQENDSDSEAIPEQQNLSIVKNEFQQSTQPVPSLGTDTDLSSLLDSSEDTISRASNTPALENSPTVTYSTTPSQVRRQLGLATQPQSLLTNSRPNSRSSSIRRQRTSLPEHHREQSKSSAIDFVSPVKFSPTQDLTQSILRPPEITPPVRIHIPAQLESPPTPEPVTQPAGATTVDGQVPVKRKTYWITTKQKQLGLVPWEAADTHPPTPSNGQPYSPLTPSLLGPSRRDSMERSVSGQKRKAAAEPRSARLPMRSYWVSTKEKQLGIVPWEAGPADSSPEPPATTHPHSTRSTRASRRASEGMDAIIGFPTAPRGAKLSYKIFQQGSQEAELLNTAIGRELLGFRPRSTKKKKIIREEEEEKMTSTNDYQPRSIDTRLRVLDDLNDDTLMAPFEEIASFLRNYPGEEPGAESGKEDGREQVGSQEEIGAELNETRGDGGRVVLLQPPTAASTSGSQSTCTSSISPKGDPHPVHRESKDHQPSRPRMGHHSSTASLPTSSPSSYQSPISPSHPSHPPALSASIGTSSELPQPISPISTSPLMREIPAKENRPASASESPSAAAHRLLLSSIG